jgi:hypothetical protein
MLRESFKMFAEPGFLVALGILLALQAAFAALMVALTS